MVAIVRAILVKDYGVALRVFKAMWSAVVVTTGDGIQPDGSYHFHNKILYSGGYGGDTAIDLASYANISQGTPFVMPNTTIQVTVDFHPYLHLTLTVFPYLLARNLTLIRQHVGKGVVALSTGRPKMDDYHGF